MADRLQSLEARLKRIEDIQAIANLKAQYLDAVDGVHAPGTHDPDLVAACFTEDAVWEVEQSGKTVGKAGIHAVMQTARATTPFAFHALANPLIEVDGDTASGEWHITGMIVASGGLDGGRGTGELFATAIYKDKFARTAAGWRIKELLCRVVFFTPFKDGWKNATHLHR